MKEFAKSFRQTPLARALRDHPESRMGLLLLALLFLGSWLLLAVIGDPTEYTAEPLLPPSWAHPMGTNGQGQEVWRQTVAGTAASLSLALITGFAMTALGAFIGLMAGYAGGRIDRILSFFINIVLVIPGLPLAFVLAAFLPSGPWTLLLVLTITGWAWTARVFRGLALSMRNKDFILAAEMVGESRLRILSFEILPNLLASFASSVIGSVIYAIGAQVGLEFLGLGDMNRISWGTNLYWASNDAALLTGSWWIFVPTGLGIALSCSALTLVSYAVDAVNNPGLRADTILRRRLQDPFKRAIGITPLARELRYARSQVAGN
ncbi:ABC transporter permease [Oligoflexus tunisiensis]|uniref:ABC transporter permease n=1 Tax=Oligoflexus tunisiensis TaxID=708132 RepID=UPI000A51B5E4|nr:ABC transporter permease [Oligoflexus tunisiensis]